MLVQPSGVRVGTGRDSKRFDSFIEELPREPVEVGLVAQWPRLEILTRKIRHWLLIARFCLITPELNVYKCD